MSIARSRHELAVDVGVQNWADPDRYAPLAHALAGKKKAIAWPRAGKARFALTLMALSFLGGAWSRDMLSTHQVDVMHAALSQTKVWVADRVAALRTASTERTAPAVPLATAVSTPSAKASSAALAPTVSAPEPPEVSFSSLPRAPALTHRGLVRAPTLASPPAPVHTHAAPPPSPVVEDVPAPARVPVHARTAPSPVVEDIPVAAPAPVHAGTAPAQAEADTADLIPEPKAATEPPKATASPRTRTQEAPLPAPGSLEDLIRKEVQKEQSNKH